jgi:TonB family protein
MRVVVAIIALLLVCRPAAAQEQSAAASCNPPSCERPKLTKAVQPAYSAADKASGAQGDVVVRLTVQADGTATDIEVAETSHSSVLDAAAVEAVRASSFVPGRIDGNAAPLQMSVAFEFVKDSISNLAQKTCADLGADVAFFRQAFPDQPLNKMRIASLSSGTVMISRSNGNLRSQLAKELIERRRGAFERTVAWCEQNPSGLYFRRFIEESN